MKQGALGPLFFMEVIQLPPQEVDTPYLVQDSFRSLVCRPKDIGVHGSTFSLHRSFAGLLHVSRLGRSHHDAAHRDCPGSGAGGAAGRRAANEGAPAAGDQGGAG
ncbi:hypothetical protein AERO9A_420013 [Aeromonas salmonicida]|nr:hypothetical protein AERO9A_420013 [Aeromonas salmonicida]